MGVRSGGCRMGGTLALNSHPSSCQDCVGLAQICPSLHPESRFCFQSLCFWGRQVPHFQRLQTGKRHPSGTGSLLRAGWKVTWTSAQPPKSVQLESIQPHCSLYSRVFRSFS